eukprot:9934565-Alexandrium_andersonii.AAC.1
MALRRGNPRRRPRCSARARLGVGHAVVHRVRRTGRGGRPSAQARPGLPPPLMRSRPQAHGRPAA